MPNPRLDLSGGVWRWAVVIGGGILASTLAQSGTLDLPIRNLLTSKFEVAKLDPCVEATGSLHTISEFFAIAAFPWYLKFIVGVFSDSVPLLGTMRRHYVLLSATAAAILWLLAGQIQYSYLSLLAVITAMETMLVVCSTVTGALLVEVGQRLDAAGRLVAARIFVEGICSVVAGPLAELAVLSDEFEGDPLAVHRHQHEGYQSGPPRLVAGSATAAGVAVKVLVKRNQVAPERIAVE